MKSNHRKRDEWCEDEPPTCNAWNIVGMVQVGMGILVILMAFLLPSGSGGSFSFPAAFSKLATMLFGMWLSLLGALFLLKR